ncbi:MAG: HlyD family efflux transporter periplasmic adaptor subunit [Elusimicrobia bacterium]|nr:HlyD family efflux transporter periplasmic adaptor subunit [Elusimicrobiota bacterium]
MKTKIFFALKLLAVAAVAAGAVAGVWKLYAKYTRASAASEVDKPVKVSKGRIEVTFQDIGDILSRDFRDIKSGTDGKIIGLYVNEGQTVKSGDRLVTVRGGRSEAEAYTPVTINSPMPGLVVKCVDSTSRSSQSVKFVQEGDVVSSSYGSNATCIMRIVNMARLGVDLEISENDITKIKKDARVQVTLDAIPGAALPGSISMISPQAEQSGSSRSGNKIFRVAITLDRIDPRIRLGMTARVRAVMDARDNVLKVPLMAVFFEGAQAYAYKAAVNGGKPERVSLKLGLRNEMEVEALSGVSEGDELLVEKPE